MLAALATVCFFISQVCFTASATSQSKEECIIRGNELILEITEAFKPTYGPSIWNLQCKPIILQSPEPEQEEKEKSSMISFKKEIEND